MKAYFITPYFNGTLLETGAIFDEEKAKAIFDKENDTMPHDMYMHDGATKMVYKWGFPGWKECFRAYVAVRNNPGVNYPETVICEDGIFDTIEDAWQYIEKNGGRWKIYSFNELREKLCSDIKLLNELSKDWFDEHPF